MVIDKFMFWDTIFNFMFSGLMSFGEESWIPSYHSFSGGVYVQHGPKFYIQIKKLCWMLQVTYKDP